MKRGGIPFVVYGGLFAFLASVLLVLLEYLGGLSGAPDWVFIFFVPGMYVGVWTWSNVTHNMTLCYAAGVLTMTLLGALLGALVE